MSTDYRCYADPELIEKVTQDDLDAWKELVRRNRDILKGIAKRRGYEEARDLESDVYAHLKRKNDQWEKLKQYSGNAPFSNWLSSVARHLGVDRQRKNKAVEQHEVTEADLSPDQRETFLDAVEDIPGADPAALAEMKELRTILLKGISKLSDLECQLLLREVFWGGERITDVARWIGIEPNSAYQKKGRNLEKLEQILRKKWPDYPWHL